MNIRTIAKELGVSTATVSRAINKSGYVKQETREKIEKYILENNYVPSAIARSLSRQNTRSIGVIVPDIENEFFSKIFGAIGEIAETNNFNIFYFGTGENSETEHRALQTVWEQRVSGIIIAPVLSNDEITKKMLNNMVDKGVPVVLIDRDLKGSTFDGVFIDSFKGAYDAITTFIKNGHTKIGIISGPETSMPGQERLRGYISALEDNRIALREEYIVNGDFRTEKAYNCMKELANLEDPPTAVFTSNNLSTLGCLKYLNENGYTIGKDISLIGFDDIEYLNYVGFPLSVVNRAVRRMGSEAINIIMERLKDEQDGNKENLDNVKRIIFSPELLLRGSEKIG